MPGELMEDQGVVPIGYGPLHWLHHQGAEKASGELVGGVLVAVVPEGPGIPGHELVAIGGSRGNGILGHTGDSILGVGDPDAVPVDCGGGRKMVDERHSQAVSLTDPELWTRDDPIERPGCLAAYLHWLSHQREAAQRLGARRCMQALYRDCCLPHRNRSAHVHRRRHALCPSPNSNGHEQQPGHQRRDRPDPEAYPSSWWLLRPPSQAHQVPGRHELEDRGCCIGYADRLWMPGVVTDREADRTRDEPQTDHGEVRSRANNGR